MQIIQYIIRIISMIHIIAARNQAYHIARLILHQAAVHPVHHVHHAQAVAAEAQTKKCSDITFSGT